jgi:hypothetical protein
LDNGALPWVVYINTTADDTKDNNHTSYNKVSRIGVAKYIASPLYFTTKEFL